MTEQSIKDLELTCEVCKKESAVGVASVPGVPYSAAYGRECLNANAHPYWIVVANTAMIGGYERAAEWWQRMVDDTLTHLGKDRAAFDAEVRTTGEQLEQEEREYQEAAEKEGKP